MERVYNFSAGPAVLPLPVLEKAAAEMTSYGQTGTSVMEMSHRSAPFEEIIAEARSLLRKLMNIGDDYEVLFLQGGATGQFAAVPLNLMATGKADYVVTGNFASTAMKEAARYGKVNVVASSEPDNYTYIPDLPASIFDPEADYTHITTNNTIFGTKYTKLPETPSPLVADMSSNILSEPYDVTKFGLIYAGAQKNIGPAGLTVVIVRKDLLGRAMAHTPNVLNYTVQAKNESMLNTPPTYAVYIAKLCFEWLLEQGGVEGIWKTNVEKAKILYDYLDETAFYKTTAQKEFRSIMNVTFTTPSKELDSAFVKFAETSGYVNLKGHRLVGGMRASIYNAMPVEGVKALVEFMKKFEAENK